MLHLIAVWPIQMGTIEYQNNQQFLVFSAGGTNSNKIGAFKRVSRTPLLIMIQWFTFAVYTLCALNDSASASAFYSPVSTINSAAARVALGSNVPERTLTPCVRGLFIGLLPAPWTLS